MYRPQLSKPKNRNSINGTYERLHSRNDRRTADAITQENQRLRLALKTIAEAYANNEPISAQWAEEALNPKNE